MEINPNQQEYIDRYLRGELKGQELEEFFETLKNDPVMANALQIQESIVQGIEYRGNQELKKRLQQISSEARDKKITPASAPNNKARVIRYVIIGLAAAITLLIISTFIFQKTDTEQLFANYYQPSQFSITRQIDIEAEIARAENFYNNANYTAAIPVLQGLLRKQPENAAIQLALGNALLNSEAPERAIAEFQNIIERNAPLYIDQAKWYLALTHLKLGNIENCKKLLQELVSDNEADFHTQAVNLLKEL